MPSTNSTARTGGKKYTDQICSKDSEPSAMKGSGAPDTAHPLTAGTSTVSAASTPATVHSRRAVSRSRTGSRNGKAR